MILTLEQIRSITQGAAEVCREDGFICFYRFSQPQRNLYESRCQEKYARCLSTSGIRLKFRTDSSRLHLCTELTQAASGTYFCFDILVNGKSVGYLAGDKLPGLHQQSFSLGDGTKSVEVYFPWAVGVKLKSLELDDGAVIQPVRREKKILMYGDSITQGYCSQHAYNSYTALLADALDAEEFNRGVGGEVCFPELAETQEPFTPDYITVAYGTNDWNVSEEDDFILRYRKFLNTASQKYPGAKIFAISPIWRKDHEGQRWFGDFYNVEKDIKAICRELENVTFISGDSLVPHDESYFHDLRLHPNDKGFACYFSNLHSAVKSAL